jgi:hypothetical protein
VQIGSWLLSPEYGVCLRVRIKQSSALSWPVSRHHTQETETNCQFVHVPLEDGINISPKHVRQRLNKSTYFALRWLLYKLYFKMHGPYNIKKNVICACMCVCIVIEQEACTRKELGAFGESSVK